MEQQQCPVCMLYLLPGMNLQDHLDTHPKDMIIKALLTAKSEPAKTPVINEAATTVYLAAPFNPSQVHIYQDQLQQQQQPIQNNLTLTKSNTNFNNSNNTVLFNNRPYRLTLDSPQTIPSTSTAPTFLNTNSNFGSRASVSEDQTDNNTAAFRCIQNTEQKNDMIVNTSFTQFIQQTLPVKKQGAATATAIELHPVIVDNATPSSAISIIPRYANEKYSHRGPPPSYSTAISSVTNTINDKPRVIGFSQTPTLSTIKVVEKHGGNNNSSKMTLSNSSTEENRHLMIRAPRKILEYTRTENGDFMITEKMVESPQPSTSIITQEEEIIEDSPSAGDYNIKFIDIENQMSFDLTADDENDEKYIEETQIDVIEKSEENQEETPEEESVSEKEETAPIRNHHGVKVLSDVKVTSSEMFSPSIKDIIQQYNSHNIKSLEELDGNDDDETSTQDIKEEEISLIHCTETLNLSKDKDDSLNACTSVICKTTLESEVKLEMPQKEDPQPSTSGYMRKSNVVFSSNPSNRLKLNKQPKKLIVKLKKPLPEEGSAPKEDSTQDSRQPMKEETSEKKIIFLKEISSSKSSENMEVDSCKVENPKHYDKTFLDQHDYEATTKTVESSSELYHNSETNQSLMSMDLETENNLIKNEQEDAPVVIKTELSCLSKSSSTSQSSCSSSNPGPSRLTIESVTSANECSSLNFLYHNDRIRFSPPLSPYVYMKTLTSSIDEQPSQETENSWNASNSLAIQNSDQNSTSSRYTPSFDENRSSYTDLDGGNNKTSPCIGDGHTRAASTDSLNIRTDEKMPARGEISEQESNGEIEQPWHQQYFQLPTYPSSYDMTAQECWNLSKTDSQNACDSNTIHNVIINFPSLNAQNDDIKTPDLLKTILQPKQEPAGLDDEASGSNSNLIMKRNRTFRCPECSKFFSRLRARNRHIEQAHPHLKKSKKTKSVPTSTQTTSSYQENSEVKVLSIVKSEPSTSAAVLVKNEMNRMLISTTGSIKMEMDRLMLEPSTSSASQQLSTLGLKIKRTYMCAKCNEQFRTLKLLDKHFQVHPAECTLCQKTFNSWNTFSLHLKHHLNIRVHGCRFCPKRFVQRQRLVEHERVHTGAMPIKCPHCDERFRRYSNMLHHRARVHLNKKAKQEDFVCDCGEIFQTKAKLEWHQETHENKPKNCPYCRERFTHRNSLTRHIRLSHTEKYVFAKSKAVNCPICNSTYLPSSIKAHMATHQTSNKEYSCSICSKQFSTKWNLKQHHWTHANRSTKPFQCNVCPSAFVRETDYTTHMNAHRSIKPFTCNTCGKRFVRKYNWLRHSREHEREKKFVCETCNKKFHRAYYLTEHKRVHTGERPFSCTICGKTSATKTNHNKHIKIHHARDPLTAEG